MVQLIVIKDVASPRDVNISRLYQSSLKVLTNEEYSILQLTNTLTHLSGLPPRAKNTCGNLLHFTHLEVKAIYEKGNEHKIRPWRRLFTQAAVHRETCVPIAFQRCKGLFDARHIGQVASEAFLHRAKATSRE